MKIVKSIIDSVFAKAYSFIEVIGYLVMAALLVGGHDGWAILVLFGVPLLSNIIRYKLGI
ncbi:hypothetical protein [Brevibacillus sp. NRS-1366]|uniref:hypothetical protein n=1 Tax=Brevibacillus sp. NRS-1366 TaxID=3233899 RepID=UPI003D1EEBE5